jgi:hypothetical protein
LSRTNPVSVNPVLPQIPLAYIWALRKPFSFPAATSSIKENPMAEILSAIAVQVVSAVLISLIVAAARRLLAGPAGA